MTGLVRFLTHPQVVIDPDIPVPDWGLSQLGRDRVDLLTHVLPLRTVRSIFCSPERKAIETATPLARAIGISLEIVPSLRENDRSSTGYLPPGEFEAHADAFFANPRKSVAGWETAADAQSRVCRGVEYALRAAPPGDVLLVGHGATGTLAWCALAGRPINRSFDQPAGGGCLYTFRRDDREVLSGWQTIEAFTGRG